MNCLPIDTHQGELVADSRNVAKILGVDHKSIFQAVLNTYEELIQLGQLITDESGYAIMNLQQWVFIMGDSPLFEAAPEAKASVIISFSKAKNHWKN